MTCARPVARRKVDLPPWFAPAIAQRRNRLPAAVVFFHPEGERGRAVVAKDTPEQFRLRPNRAAQRMVAALRAVSQFGAHEDAIWKPQILETRLDPVEIFVR